MSNNSKPGRARVRRLRLPSDSPQKGLATLERVCAAGERSRNIIRSETGRQALADLQSAVRATNKTLSVKQSLAAQVAEASKSLGSEVDELVTALRLYETSVAAVSRGNPAVMRSAGFEARAWDRSKVFGAVTGAKGRPAVHAAESLVTWPAVRSAKVYALQVRLNPDDPVVRWRDAGTSRSRRRVVKGPSPAAKIEVRIAAIKRDGTRAPWSEPILVQTR